MNLGLYSIIRVELRWVLIGLNLAWNVGYRNVIVQTDFRAANSLLTNDDETIHHCSLEVIQFKELRSTSWEIKICHVFREGNHVVDL
ncbi:hypothetical protein LINPERHAP1_LOCUS119 [Linum perenne]